MLIRPISDVEFVQSVLLYFCTLMTSVSVLQVQVLVGICAAELEFLDMAINVKKSACMRFGLRHKNICCKVVVSGHSINWVESAKYLGVYLVNSTKFKCSLSNNKTGFFSRHSIVFSER